MNFTSLQIKFHHSHRVNVAEAYSYLRIAPNIRETFFQYFNEGMTSASARNYHELLIENSQEFEEPKLAMALVLANAQSNPTERQVRHLFDIWRYIILHSIFRGSYGHWVSLYSFGFALT